MDRSERVARIVFGSLGVIGLGALSLSPALGWGSESSCQANLTCLTSSPSVVRRPKSQGPDLSGWRLIATAEPSGSRDPTEPPPARLDDETLGIEMVLIPGACYEVPVEQGAVPEGKKERCLTPFYLGVYEVTFDAYDRFARETGRDLPDDEGWGRGSRPVINVNLYDALGLTKWLSRRSGVRYRLPTETEWEHAARAGVTTTYPWGEGVGPGLANCAGCGSPWDGQRTAPVGSFPPNPWGLHDMVGNVGEWTCSMRDPDPRRSYGQCDGIYETRRRVYRNGGWSDRPERLALSFRDWNAAIRRTDDVGFRLVRECPECLRPTPAESVFARTNPPEGEQVKGEIR